jgi:hypothetical protein
MQPNFDLLKKQKNKSLPRQLARRSVGLAAGIQLVAISKQMEKLKMEPAKPEVDENESDEYEFVFYEEAIHSFRRVTLMLVEKCLRNGIPIDQSILEEAKEHIEMFDYLLEKKEKDEADGN